MGDSATKGRQPLPAALGQRERIITLSDGTGSVTVRKWSWSKSIAMFKHLAEILAEVPDSDVKKLSGRGYQVAAGAIEILGDRIIPILQLSVSEEDGMKFSGDSSPEDIIGILEAVLEVNMTEGLTKKARGLWKRLVQSGGTNPASTS